MIILPAIDMIDGKPVRLYQGDYTKKQVVADSVIDTARSFERDGAEYIHMVDLDGAKTGKKENASIIVETAQKVNVPIEVGGGIRTIEDIDYYMDNGIARVILGTVAINNPDLLKQAIDKYGKKIAVGMDCKNGFAMAEGWLNASDLYYLSFAKKLEEIGVQNIIFTDISKDGTLEGPNLEMLQQLEKSVNVSITASGGIKDLGHIQQLAELGLYGAITGKAIYSGTLDLKDAIRIGKENA